MSEDKKQTFTRGISDARSNRNIGRKLSHTGGNRWIQKPKRHDTEGRLVHVGAIQYDEEFKGRLSNQPLEEVKSPERIRRVPFAQCGEKYKASESDVKKHYKTIPELVPAKLTKEEKASLKRHHQTMPKVLSGKKETDIFFCPTCGKDEKIVDKYIKKHEHYVRDDEDQNLFYKEDQPEKPVHEKPRHQVYDEFVDPDYKGPYPAVIHDWDPKRDGKYPPYHKTKLPPTKREISESINLKDKEPEEITRAVNAKHKSDLEAYIREHPDSRAKYEADIQALDLSANEQVTSKPSTKRYIPKEEEPEEEPILHDEELKAFSDSDNPEDKQKFIQHFKKK